MAIWWETPTTPTGMNAKNRGEGLSARGKESMWIGPVSLNTVA